MDLMKLKKYEPIHIIGHSNTDVDSIVSSSILCDIFNFYGIKSYYAILDRNYELDDFTNKVINDCMKYKPVVVSRKDVSKYNWFLVDHNDKNQSVGQKANIIGCIDHHMDSLQIKKALISDMCSNALFIYDIFKDKYSFSNEQKYQIFLAFLCDSKFGKSSRFKELDKKVADTLGFGDDYSKYFNLYFKPSDVNCSVNELLLKDYKCHNYNNYIFYSCSIDSFGVKKLNDFKKLISKQKNYLGIWKDYSDNVTYVYFSYKSKIKEFKYNFLASRSTTVIKDVLKYIRDEG